MQPNDEVVANDRAKSCLTCRFFTERSSLLLVQCVTHHIRNTRTAFLGLMTTTYNVVQTCTQAILSAINRTTTLDQTVKKNDYGILTFNPMQSARHIY